MRVPVERGDAGNFFFSPALATERAPSVVLLFNASASVESPASPIGFASRSRVVSVEFPISAAASAATPSGPMLQPAAGNRGG